MITFTTVPNNKKSRRFGLSLGWDTNASWMEGWIYVVGAKWSNSLCVSD